jgi:hypothetical protein
MSLVACENEPTVPCTLHCATRTDGCEVSSEFVPLGTVESQYAFRFGPIDRAGQWLVYSREWIGGRYDYTPYRWSAADGVVLLGDALGVPPTSDRHESLIVRKAAANGSAFLLQRMNAVDPAEAYVWTQDAGLATLDFEPSDMSANGRVVVGVQGRAAVIWDRERGTRALDAGALDEGSASDAGVPTFSPTDVRLSDTGELALVWGVGGLQFQWTEAQGMVPLEALPGFPAGAWVTVADPNGPVLWASTGDVFSDEPQRLWRWTEREGVRALDTLPLLPSDTDYVAWMSLANGQVLLGRARTTPGAGDVAFRWSSDLGMQQISDLAYSTGYYGNPDGTTVVGYVNTDGSVSSSFRWTARSGTSHIPGDVRGGIAFGGDLLLALDWDGTKVVPRMLKYDSALENGGTLPIDIIDAGLLPEGYRLRLIEAISDNARLLAGTALDAEGTVHGWLLRLHDSCSP